MHVRPELRVLAAAVALFLAAGCRPNQATAPGTMPDLNAAPTRPSNTDATVASGERIVGNAAIEPAFNADNGNPMYLLTPTHAPLPAHADSNAISPLYIVEYPTGSTASGTGRFNCEGVPGNCPDHDGLIASVAAGAEPTVYANGVLGHDHIGDPPGKPDFNVAWEVVVVAFTPQGVADGAVNTRLTTDAAIKAAIAANDAVPVDIGISFNCSVVPATVYWKGTPIG